MPDLIRFSYTPKSELQTDKFKTSQANEYPDSSLEFATEDGHVLVLDFTDSLKGGKSKAGYIFYHFHANG